MPQPLDGRSDLSYEYPVRAASDLNLPPDFHESRGGDAES